MVLITNSGLVSVKMSPAVQRSSKPNTSLLSLSVSAAATSTARRQKPVNSLLQSLLYEARRWTAAPAPGRGARPVLEVIKSPYEITGRGGVARSGAGAG